MDIVVSAIRERHQYINCKPFYFLFHYFCKMNLIEDKFNHSPSFSFNEVKRLIMADIINILDVDLEYT